MRDEQTNEYYLQLNSTVVLKRKQEVLYVLLNFENSLTVDALVDSRAYVSAILQKYLDTKKQKAPNIILKIDDPPYLQTQFANGQLEKPLATTTLKIEIGGNIFAKHFVVMKKLRERIKGLPFMGSNSVVIDMTHCLIHFPHLTMLVKTASSQTTAKSSLPTLMMPWRYHWGQQKQTQRWPSVRMENDRDCDTTRKFYGSSNFADFPFNVDNIWTEKSSQGNQFNGITICYQQEYTERRVLRSHSGAIQAHQTNWYGNLQYDSTTWSWPDCLPKWTPQNEKTWAAKQLFLVPDTWKSWKFWGSHPNTDTNSQRINLTQKQGKTQPKREHRFSKPISQTDWLD